jgi:hypothetical protein
VHTERFSYEGGAYLVEIDLGRRHRVNPASLALLQVIADIVFTADQNSALANPSDPNTPRGGREGPPV